MVDGALGSSEGPARGPARLRRPVRSRVSSGHAVMLAAGLLGALATVAALRSADHRVPVLAARGDLVAGAVLTRDDLRTVRVGGDAAAMSTLVRADDADALVGRVVTTGVVDGRLLAPDDVQARAGGRVTRSMSFPIARARALDGDLRAGDVVDVVATADRDDEARFVATGVEVVRVGGDGRSTPLGGTDAITVTLAVEPDVALAVATAAAGDGMTLVRATGAPAIEVAP
jgi:Flp pilus assembly protein CpaB